MIYRMKPMALIVGAFLFALSSFAQSRFVIPSLENEQQLAIERLFANLRNSPTKGAIMASPSTFAPDYYYHWTRDAALTQKSLFDLYNFTDDSKLKQDIEVSFKEWVDFEIFAQKEAEKQPAGLAEPRFFLDGLVNTSPWGRPQTDGPATRALTMSLWALKMLNEGSGAYVSDKLYRAELPATSAIKKDLEFVAHHWRDATIDLWEEVRGTHFYTLSLQRKSLLVGAELADKMKDPLAAGSYRDEAAKIKTALQRFLDTGKPYIVVTLDEVRSRGQLRAAKGKESRLDIAIILAAIHGLWGDEFFLDNITMFSNTLAILEEKFQAVYPEINRESLGNINLGTAMGRYPEDVYDGSGFTGANPWFISTHAAAEYYCRLALLEKRPEAAQVLKNKGLSFLKRSLKHRDQDTGALSEQYSRFNGYQVGAKDLTWSYASYITAFLACR